MRTLCYLFLLGFLTCAVSQAEATVAAHSTADQKLGVWHLDVTGEITAADAANVRLWRKQYGRIVSANMDSAGGDVQAAMQIGRLLRQDQAEGSTTHCVSACVLVYIGLVSRPTLGDNQLAIHRPFGTEVAATYAQEKILVDQRNAAIDSYLREMNVSPALLDAMNRVPSYTVRPLTQAAAEDFGISRYDPVYLEQQQGLLAKRLGVSTVELQRRIALKIRRCDPSSANGTANAGLRNPRLACERGIGLL